VSAPSLHAWQVIKSQRNRREPTTRFVPLNWSRRNPARQNISIQERLVYDKSMQISSVEQVVSTRVFERTGFWVGHDVGFARIRARHNQTDDAKELSSDSGHAI
jgi:hypothetical protein